MFADIPIFYNVSCRALISQFAYLSEGSCLIIIRKARVGQIQGVLFKETLAAWATVSSFLEVNIEQLTKGRNVLENLFSIIMHLISKLTTAEIFIGLPFQAAEKMNRIINFLNIFCFYILQS